MQPESTNQKGLQDFPAEVQEPNATIKARVVQGSEDAVFGGPEKDVVGCPTIPGKKPLIIKDKEEARRFIKKAIPERCFQNEEAVVIIGNEYSDIDWVLQTLEKRPEDERLLTVYNPRTEAEVSEAEARLEAFLALGKGALVTLGRDTVTQLEDYQLHLSSNSKFLFVKFSLNYNFFLCFVMSCYN